MIFDKCPKCGGELLSLTYTTKPPTNAQRCTKCGWEYEEGKDNMAANTTSTTTTGYGYQQYCYNRLPCGICTRTNSMCPLNTNINVTWTCGTTATNKYSFEIGDVKVES